MILQRTVTTTGVMIKDEVLLTQKHDGIQDLGRAVLRDDSMMRAGLEQGYLDVAERVFEGDVIRRRDYGGERETQFAKEMTVRDIAGLVEAGFGWAGFGEEDVIDIAYMDVASQE